MSRHALVEVCYLQIVQLKEVVRVYRPTQCCLVTLNALTIEGRNVHVVAQNNAQFVRVSVVSEVL